MLFSTKSWRRHKSELPRENKDEEEKCGERSVCGTQQSVFVCSGNLFSVWLSTFSADLPWLR